MAHRIDDEHAAPARFPARLYREGTEPDPRFSLANERTFLAWIRTAVALVAAGVALEALDLGLHPGIRRTAALLLICAGLLAPLQAWAGWYETERALRRARPLPAARLALPVAAVVLVSAALLVVGVLAR